jgi:NAD(P)-dependent dehydrogenase (short-subunit alcohol dehydrogenase family)
MRQAERGWWHAPPDLNALEKRERTMTSSFADFTGLSVIITGAGSGIGRASARAFARSGAWVLAVGRRADRLAETAADTGSIVPFVADVRREGAAQAIVGEAARRWDRLDVLVNNAGVFSSLPLAEVTGPSVLDVVDTNVTAPSLLAAEALPLLREHRGTIVNVSSTFGHRPAPGFSHYGASKAAIEHLTRSWAAELAADGIRVNAVAPGPTESEALVAAGLSEVDITKIKREEAARIPLGRRGDPTEVARWIVHLADPEASWVTGQVIAIDGGLAVA